MLRSMIILFERQWKKKKKKGESVACEGRVFGRRKEKEAGRKVGGWMGALRT